MHIDEVEKDIDIDKGKDSDIEINYLNRMR